MLRCSSPHSRGFLEPVQIVFQHHNPKIHIAKIHLNITVKLGSGFNSVVANKISKDVSSHWHYSPNVCPSSPGHTVRCELRYRHV